MTSEVHRPGSAPEAIQAKPIGAVIPGLDEFLIFVLHRKCSLFEATGRGNRDGGSVVRDLDGAVLELSWYADRVTPDSFPVSILKDMPVF